MGSVNVLAGMVLSLPVFLHLPFHTFYSTWLGLKAMTHRTAYVQPPATTADSDTLWFCVALGNAALPASNQVFLGENHPDATRCSAHIWTTQRVTDPCGGEITYALRLFPADGSGAIQVIMPSVVSLDLSNSAELSFDTRTSSLEPNHPVRLNGLPYTSGSCSGANGLHRMEWVIMNTCGDTTVITSFLSVEDCRLPMPLCVGHTSISMPSSGGVMLYAKDLILSGLDDCARDDELLVSFSGELYVPFRDIKCYETCLYTSILLQVWVADGGVDVNCNGTIEWSERNKDFCTTFIQFDHFNNICECYLTWGGHIRRPNGAAVPEALVHFTNGFENDSVISNVFGWYSQTLFFHTYWQIDIRPVRNTNHREGVSTLDLIAMQKHLLGLELIDNPYQFIAADVNNSGTLSVLDLIEIRKLILGVFTEFPKNTSWRFVPADHIFQDTLNPGIFPEVFHATVNTPLVDFIGVKIGDINGSAPGFRETEISTRSKEGSLRLQIDDLIVKGGEDIIVPVYAGEQKTVLGFQFTLDLNGLAFTGIEPAQLDMSHEYVAVHRDAVSMSWFDLKVPDLTNREPLFYLRFVPTQDGRLSSMLSISSGIAKAEAYFKIMDSLVPDVVDVMLKFIPVQDQSSGVTLLQNVPNPFNRETMVGFALPEASHIVLSVYDIHGHTVFEHKGSYPAGVHHLVVPSDQLPHCGIYVYRLRADGHDITRRMLRLE